MDRFHALKLASAISFVLLLSACSSLPPQLVSDNPHVITQYDVWQSQPQKTQEVRLGGVIANVTNLTSKTRVEIVNLPINSAGKPDINQEPTGRFAAYFTGFIDPVTFAEGRLITVLGKAIGTEQADVGEFEYTFPVMAVQGHRLWRIEERVIIYSGFDDFAPCFGRGCYDTYSSPRQGRVMKDVR